MCLCVYGTAKIEGEGDGGNEVERIRIYFSTEFSFFIVYFIKLKYKNENLAHDV